MKKFTILAALAAASVASPALAQSSCTATGTNSCFINYTLNVGGTFGNTDPAEYPPLFQDLFNFATTFDRNATVEINSSKAGLDFSYNVNFVSNGVKLNGTVIPATSTGDVERRYLANFRIPAGAQQIFVQGSAQENGTYSGILTLSGVPEPSTWAMMILGIGLAGSALRARRRTQGKVSFA